MLSTVFKTGPGLFCVNSKAAEAAVPDGTVRIYMASIEAYDMPKGDKDCENLHFTLLVAMAEGNPQLARALLTLSAAIEQNRKRLQAILK